MLKLNISKNIYRYNLNLKIQMINNNLNHRKIVFRNILIIVKINQVDLEKLQSLLSKEDFNKSYNFIKKIESNQSKK